MGLSLSGHRRLALLLYCCLLQKGVGEGAPRKPNLEQSSHKGGSLGSRACLLALGALCDLEQWEGDLCWGQFGKGRQ